MSDGEVIAQIKDRRWTFQWRKRYSQVMSLHHSVHPDSDNSPYHNGFYCTLHRMDGRQLLETETGLEPNRLDVEMNLARCILE